MEDFNDKQIKILDTAEQLMLRERKKDVSVREICNALGINIAMISYYFGSKEGMLQSVYENKLRKLRGDFSLFTQMMAPASPAKQLNEILKFIIVHFDEAYFLKNNTHKPRETSREQQYLQDFYKVCFKRLEDLMHKGIAVGEFHRVQSPEDLLASIMGTVSFALQNKWLYRREAAPLEGAKFDYKVQQQLLLHLSSMVAMLLKYKTQK